MLGLISGTAKETNAEAQGTQVGDKPRELEKRERESEERHGN